MDSPGLLAIVLMVKNEAQAIKKTLDPYIAQGISHFFVFDTGSTDKTVEVTQAFFEKNNIQGFITQEAFIDFSASRNRALELAESYFPEVAFFLMPDAEWHLHHPEMLIAFCEQEKNTDKPLYLLKIKVNTLDFTTARLFRRSAKIRFYGVVHEVPAIPTLDCLPTECYFEVLSSKVGHDKSKRRWEQDVELLLKEYCNNPQDPRTLFYLAQTYECLGELEKAYEFYQYREGIAGWVEENFITLFRLGGLAEKMSKLKNTISWSTAMDYYLKAFACRPQRIEPLVKIADHYWPDNIPACYLYARYACEAPYPKTDLLFVEKELYDYARFEILSRCAWHMGEYKLGESATRQALQVHPNVEHLQRNLTVYQEKLGILTQAMSNA